MKDRTFNNADSFAMSFDEEWQRIECDDVSIKIKKIIEILSDHPFVKSNQDTAFKIANFRVKSLGKFKWFLMSWFIKLTSTINWKNLV